MNLELSEDGISSLELLKEINFWRGKESEGAEKERTELRHDTLLAIIRDEFEREISLQKLLESKYKSERGKEYPCFNLTLSQAKQVLLRESKFVRRNIITYIEKLESVIKEKSSTEWLNDRRNGIMVRRKETDAIQQYLIPLAIEQGSTNYKNFYSIYTNLVHKFTGVETGMRSKCNRDALRYLEFLESAVENCIITECSKNTHYKDIYQVCKHKCELLKEVLQPPTVKYLAEDTLAIQE